MPKVEKQKSESLPAVRLPLPLAEWVASQANAEGMNVSEFVRYLLLTAKRRGDL